MWDSRLFVRIDFRLIPILLCLMAISLLVISSMTGSLSEWDTWQAPLVQSQLRWFCLGWLLFVFFAGMDYRKLRDCSLILYGAMLLLLLGLFFVDPIQNVHRWYRIPGIASFQPSEYAKLALVIFFSWFLERKGQAVGSWKSALQAGILVGVPFLMIFKQPDLGTSLILYPIALAMAYIAGIRTSVIRFFAGLGGLLVLLVALFFTEILSHEEMRPYCTSILKEYQYERLNPNTYHQKAAATAIAIGGIGGKGWRQSDFAARKWLPAAHTDSVFAAYGEEFGLLGVIFLLLLFYVLIYVNAQVAVVARDPFGRFLAVGLSVYLGVHVLANIAMMCSLLPISGVPLILVSYGGSSLLTTMAALGLLQSIYSRRFMF